MIRSGFTIHNPLTGSRTEVLEADAETKSRGWLLELRCQPGAAPDIAEHLHLTWTEEFEIVAGAAHYKLDGVQGSAGAGDRIVVGPGQTHVHPWAAGDDELVYRQRNHFNQTDPTAVNEVLGVFATLARLAEEGKLDAAGLPKHPLQLAATMRTLIKHGGYDAKLPVGVQNVISATLGRLAEVMGYRGVDPRAVGE